MSMFNDISLGSKDNKKECESNAQLVSLHAKRFGAGHTQTSLSSMTMIIDDDMDSDTATESNLSLKSRSFLNRVNDRLRKISDYS